MGEVGRNGRVTNTLYRLKRGMAAYISYLAACEMNESFSEYLLYEPTLRILTACDWAARCEYGCPGIAKAGPGDYKKLDFVCTDERFPFAIEMKWAKTGTASVDTDLEKLSAYLNATPGSRAFLFVFGRKSVVERFAIAHVDVREQG